ncbi:hypothetical protein GW17_00052715 [Ensete ventricosum]|nr:hypothetical protein GW17_00052715 [Ensete ventricosum]RZR87384.1 hypothetical protein BHM03_00014793 [Ensete ventricosum]
MHVIHCGDSIPLISNVICYKSLRPLSLLPLHCPLCSMALTLFRVFALCLPASISISKRRKRNGTGERQMSINKPQDNLNLLPVFNLRFLCFPLLDLRSYASECSLLCSIGRRGTGTASFLFFDKGKPLSHSPAFLPISTSSAKFRSLITKSCRIFYTQSKKDQVLVRWGMGRR